MPSKACDSDAGKTEEEGRVRAAIAQAAHAAQSMGKVPAWMERLVEQVLNPEPDAYEVLRDFISKRVKSDQSWRRPNRRFMSQGLTMPERLSDQLGDVVVTMDCSGSVDKETLDNFANCLTGIFEAFQCRVTILYHDIPVTNVQHWVPSDGPLKLYPAGGGGTSHIPVFDWINRQDTEDAPVVVAFTDLYTNFPEKPPRLPVLWFVWGEEHSIYKRPTPPFGQVVYIKGKKR
jgi:predicted metal-dependent peptidase